MCAIYSMCDCNYAYVRRQQGVIIAEKMVMMMLIDISCTKTSITKGIIILYKVKVLYFIILDNIVWYR